MKTQTAMIPLAALLLMLMESMGFAMNPPKSTKIITDMPSINILETRNEAYPVLSTKNYQYTDNTIRQNDIIMFIFENIAIATITIDNDGNYSQNIEYLNKNTDEVSGKNSNLLDNFRNYTHKLFEEACHTVFNAKDNAENPAKEPTQADKKYFKSDYDQE